MKMHLSRKTTIGLFCYLILNYSISFGQDTRAYIPLLSSDPNSSMEDIEQLDQYFENAQIVGMGESTHGTHEFSTMRHRFFKYLVLNHGFNTVFLEADYANCLMVNEYVHGAKIDKYEALTKIDIWPWMTEEMGDLLDWMRIYNFENPENEQLSVIGVDVQKYSSTLEEIDNILEKYGIAKTDTFIYKSITNNEFLRLKKKGVKPYLTLLEKLKNINVSNFLKSDRQNYDILLRNFGQILETKKQEKNMAFRDQKMGENILYHLSIEEDAYSDDTDHRNYDLDHPW